MGRGKPFARLPTAGGADLTFPTQAAFAQWVEVVSSEWQWFINGAGTTRGLAKARGLIRAYLDQLRSLARDGGDPEQLRRETLKIFPGGAPIDPNSPAVSGLLTLYPEEPERSRAIGAYIFAAAATKQVSGIDVSEFAHPTSVRAIAQATVFEGGAPGAFKASASRTIARTSDTVSELVSKADDHITAAKKQFDELLNETRSAYDDLTRSVGEKALSAIAQITETDAKYAEVMRTKTPVDYWTTKAAQHSKSARIYRLWLTGLSIGLVPTMAVIYLAGWFAIYAFARAHPQQAIAMTVYVAGFVGAITAVGLWFIRIVVRLYMSQHHLAADADERASLLRTYQALTLTGQVDESERALVLASVFRPAPDGLVKDDGAPTLSAGTMLAAWMDNKK